MEKKNKSEKLFNKLGYIKIPGSNSDEIVYYNKETKNIITINLKTLYIDLGKNVVSWEEICAINTQLSEFTLLQNPIKELTKESELEKELKKIKKANKPDIEINYPELLKNNSKWNENEECKNCWWTKKMQNEGVYIGDSPCEWCHNNPWKITCSSQNKNV